MSAPATFETFESRLQHAREDKLRAYRVTDTLFRVVSVSSRQYKHPSRDPRRRSGLKHTKRKWHFVSCVRLSNGAIMARCNGEHCVFIEDANRSTCCKHTLTVLARLIRNPKEAELVTGVPAS